MTEEQVFLAALELPDASARAAYLEEACGTDAAFQRQVEALLAAHFRSGEFLDVPIANQGKTGAGAANTITYSGVTMSAANDRADEAEELSFLSPSTRPDSLGRLGHYEMLQVLGRGGFGIVFRAFDEVLQRVVAVKVMAPQIATLSPARRRFLREARSSAAIRHENVVQVYEVGEQPLPHLAMEFIPGETLQQKLERCGPLDVLEVLRIGRQVAQGLAAAHACDLIHRDIKPGNILLETGSDKAKITDFGLARAADDASISQSGIIAGTPMFMAPEQALGHKIDQRADLFSLGSVLYQMVSGRPPFRAPTAMAVLKRVAEETPRPIQEIIPETPEWLCAIITKLHAKNPDDRFQTAREVADLLADCESQLKANSQVIDSSRIPRGKSTPDSSERWKWVAALVPILAGVLVLTEFTGVTHLFRREQARHDSTKAGSASTPIQLVKPEPPQPAVAPFDAARAKAYQEAWAKHLGVPVEFTNSIGMKFRLIPPGEFLMGSTPAEIRLLLEHADGYFQGLLRSETPQHRVILTQPFYLGVHEVTQAQYQQIMGKNPSDCSATGGRKDAVAGLDTATHPVDTVNWNDAVEFCLKLNERERLTPTYSRSGNTFALRAGSGYRLPTEAQWEFACRAGTTTTFWCGDQADGQVQHSWPLTKLSRTHAVGELKANPFGLFDVHGNVWEWVQDWWVPDFYTQFEATVARDPCAPRQGGDEHVIRGGGWWGPVSACRSAVRRKEAVGIRHNTVGFRVALPVETVKQLVQDQAAPLATFTNSIGMEFVLVPKGKSWLGGGKEKLGDEKEFPTDFYLGKYEVTQEEWEKVMGENPSHFSRNGEGKDAVKDIPDVDLKRFPVENVSWEQCQVFVEKLNKLEKETGWVYRLPTAAEWEYACRGGPMKEKLDGSNDFYFATPTNTLPPELANFDKRLNRPCKVGSFAPNRLGCCDMHGNLHEWCDDTEIAEDGSAQRVARGGSWDFPAWACGAGFHDTGLPAFRHFNLGLRLARVRSGVPSHDAKPMPD